MARYVGPKTDADDLATQGDVTGGGASVGSTVPDSIEPDQAGSAGTSSQAARADHAHAIAADAASTVTGTNTEGTSTSFARADHNHALGAGVVGTTQIADGAVTGAKLASGSVTVATSAPSSPRAGDLWFNSDAGKLYIYYDSFWVDPAGIGGGILTASATTITGTNAEGSATTLARADHNHAIDSTLLVPTGTIVQYAGTTAPSSWLICDGTEKAVATYPALDSVLGTTYGARTNGSGGAGSTHFRVPDLQGRVPVGKGTHADVDALGDSDGISTVANRRPKHQHTVYDPGHFHGSNASVNIAGQANVYQGTTQTAAGNTTTNTTGIKVNPEGAATSSSPTDAPPYLVVNYIIKT